MIHEINQFFKLGRTLCSAFFFLNLFSCATNISSKIEDNTYDHRGLTEDATQSSETKCTPLPIGAASIELNKSSPTQAITLFTYKPQKYQNGPLLIVFHGVERNAQDYRDNAIALADRTGSLVVAPLFDKERFTTGEYQRGNIVKAGIAESREKWTFSIVLSLISELRACEGKPNLPYYLLGHSGGGQFLVRMAAFSPGIATRIVAANPGSYLFPSRDWLYGYGFGGLPQQMSDDKAICDFLRASLTIYLGRTDTKRTVPLDTSPEAEQQGPNRIARGRHFFTFAQQSAKKLGCPFKWKKVEVAGIGHNARRMFGSPSAVAAVFGDDLKRFELESTKTKK